MKWEEKRERGRRLKVVVMSNEMGGGERERGRTLEEKGRRLIKEKKEKKSKHFSPVTNKLQVI